jgi:hypothetical protein
LKYCIRGKDLKVTVTGRSFEKKSFRIYLQVFATDNFEEMIFTPLESPSIYAGDGINRKH